MMSLIKYLLIAIGLFVWPFQVHSEIVPGKIKVVTISDHSIVVAAFPYFPRSVRKTLEGKFNSDDLPIGLLIQNYSNDYLWILKVKAQSANDAKNWIVDYYTAYSERPLGAIGGRDFFRNGEELNEWAHEKFHKALDYLLVAQNEVFEHDLFLKSKQAYHGLLFLSSRDRNCRRNDISNLQGLELIVDVYSFRERKVFELKITFTSDGSSVQNFSFSGWRKRFDEYSDVPLHLDDGTSVALFGSLSACVQKALVRSKLPFHAGVSSTVFLKFNNGGELISYDLKKPFGNSKIDKAVLSIFEGFQSCALSERLTARLKSASVQEVPMTFSFGDSCRLNNKKYL